MHTREQQINKLHDMIKDNDWYLDRELTTSLRATRNQIKEELLRELAKLEEVSYE